MTAIAISSIRADVQAQPRSAISTDIVAEYSEAMISGAEFPPLVVFHDGDAHWLADGFHRFYAYQGCERVEVECDVREGTLRDAVLYSVGANAVHGLRRTDDDKRRAVFKLLNDDYWMKWSDREIARQCGVANSFVSGLRPKDTVLKEQYEARTFTHPKTGKPTTMNTAAIGRAPRAESPAAFTCECGETFDQQVWHCKKCDHHWPMSRQECWNCTSAGKPSAASLDDAGRERRLRESMTQGDTSIFDNLFEIDRLFQRLPEPKTAAREFPRRLRHPFNSERFQEIAEWFTEFSRAWHEALDVAAE